MRRRTLLLGALAAALGTLAGCTSSKPVTAIVRIGPAPVEFRVEVAQTADQQRDGLNGRDELSAGTGMLFRFGSRSEQQVWMAGMTFPLDIPWIADGKVVAIDTLTPCAVEDENSAPCGPHPAPSTPSWRPRRLTRHRRPRDARHHRGEPLMTAATTKSELYEMVRYAMTQQPDAAARAKLLYDVTRAGYDAIKFRPDAPAGDEDDERYSAAKVSDEANAHEDRMNGWSR